MMKRSQFARSCRRLMLSAAAALAITGSVFAQSASTGKSAAGDGGYSKWDITPYGGWQWFQAFQSKTGMDYTARFRSGWVFGEKVNYDVSNHVSLEGSVQVGRDRLQLRPYGQPGFASFVTYNTQLALDVDYNFQPRTAKNRLYIMGGFAGTRFTAGSTEGYQGATGSYVQPANRLKNEILPGFNWAYGLKHYINSAYGVRFELGGRVNKAAHFGLPQAQYGANTLYIPKGGVDSSVEATVGLIIREGYVAPPPTSTLVTEALRVDVPSAPSAAPTISGARNVCAGDDLRLSVSAPGVSRPTYQWRVNGTPAAGASGSSFDVPTASGSGARNVTAAVTGETTVATSAPYATSSGHSYHLTAEPAGLGGRSASYQWIVNGQPVSGATSSSYDMPDTTGASVTVQVTVQDAPVTSAPADFTIQPLTPPTLAFSVEPSSVPYTSGPIQLAAVATPSACGGATTVRYTGEAVSGNTFTPGNVSGFDMSNRIHPQTKTVQITAIATDAKNQTVEKTAPVTVTLDPEARRLDDIVFPNMSSRVNNCGKRLLLEELTPMLRNDPGSKVILIGHRDEHEKGSKKALALDDARVLNSAAVLSAGKGICPQLDLSRIMVKDDGTDQSSTPRPAFCGASTNVKEKAGQTVKESDKNAEYRRVEVWFVPSGAADPAGLTGLTAVPQDAVSKLGCPK